MEKIVNVAKKFKIQGSIKSVEPYGDGHINGTLLVTTEKKRYILQSINNGVFKNVGVLMNNIFKVTEYLQSRGVETLRVVPTLSGELYLFEEEYFRMYDFIENTVAYSSSCDKETFHIAGKGFGEFQNQLAHFDASLIDETIPDFHNTPKRFENFKVALDNDTAGRAVTCPNEIDFILSRADTYSRVTNAFKDGSVPCRVTHNDTKLNNILIDAKKKKARAIIDLDTVMPGSLLYDFGDAIRFGANTAKEDEKDLALVHFDIDMFEAYASGFCPEVKEVLTEREKELLPYSAYLMTMECGMRFLEDYLKSDVFATRYPEHNLVRCRTQLRLASEIEQNFVRMARIVEKYV